MSNTLQEFFAPAAEKAANDLITALHRLPEDKRNWTPEATARTAADMVAECALLNGSMATVLKDRAFPADFDFAEFQRAKAELAQQEDTMQTLLQENTTCIIAAIRAIPDEDLNAEVQMPWGPMTLTQIISYPYWNMSYHEGQINYIASMLGCLE